MSNKETKARVANAFRAMKNLGISQDKVKPVLKDLLKLFDKNWVLIEEENYRALADAIFERDDQDAAERSKKIMNAQTNDHLDDEAQATEEPERPLKRLRRRHQDSQTSNTSVLNEETEATKEPERPLKRLRLRYQDGQTSNTSTDGKLGTSLVIPKEEPDELPVINVARLNRSKAIIVSPQPVVQSTAANSQVITYQIQSLGKNKRNQPVCPKPLTIQERSDLSQPSSNNQPKTQLRTEPSLQSHSTRLRDRGKGAVSLQIPSSEKKAVSASSALTVCLKEPKVEPGIIPSPEKKSTRNHSLIKPTDEPVTNDTPSLDCPDTSNGGDSSRRDRIIENSSLGPLALQSFGEETAHGTGTLNEQGNNGELPMTSGECFSNLELASSPSGEVKINLTYGLARRVCNFQMPNLEAVLKCVEDKCFKSPETFGTYISITCIMKEICECFLKLGTDSNSMSPKPVLVSPTINSASKSSATDSLDAGGLALNSLDGLIDSQSGSKLPEPRTLVPPPPCNDINDDGPQPNEMDAGDGIVTYKENNKICSEYTNSLSTIVVRQPEATPEIISSLHDAFDIAKGQEKVLISLLNEVNDEVAPSFFYIPQNAIFQNAHVNFSLANIADNNCCATCSGDCSSSSTPCACAYEILGEFAYTADGLVREELLKECISMKRNPTKHCHYFCKECPLERSKCEDIIEPCKGHLIRKFIKECWWKCNCNIQCGNRIVQRGISRRLQVFLTPDAKGWGLRTLEDLPIGAFICEYVGEVLNNAELFERILRSPKEEKHSYPVFLDAGWCEEGVLKDEEALCLDATYYGNVARFINHRCYDSNLVEIPVEMETPDHRYYHLAFFTTREVKAMEELTWDYGIDFDDQEHPIKAFHCLCGSKFCRNIRRYRSRGSRRQP